MTPEQQILYDIGKGLAALVASNLVIAIASWVRMERRLTRVETQIEVIEHDLERRRAPRKDEA